MQTLIKVRGLCRSVAWVASSAYSDHRGRMQGGSKFSFARVNRASEAVHELDLVRVIEREDRSVRIPILLACLCAKEVMCT